MELLSCLAVSLNIRQVIKRIFLFKNVYFLGEFIMPYFLTPKPILIIATVIALSACTGMSQTQRRTLSGAGIGAGVGVASTVITGGCVSCGAAVGAAAGAAGGYIYDKTKKK
jgi:hypothetical protein